MTTTVPLCTFLRCIAEARAEYPLQADLCDRIARAAIAEITMSMTGVMGLVSLYQALCNEEVLSLRRAERKG